jgi:hypothetical protein
MMTPSPAAAPFDGLQLTHYSSIFSVDGPNGTTPIAGLISVNNILYGTASDLLGWQHKGPSRESAARSFIAGVL